MAALGVLKSGLLMGREDFATWASSMSEPYGTIPKTCG